MQRDEDKEKRHAKILRRANAPLLRGPIHKIGPFMYTSVIETPESEKVGMVKPFTGMLKPASKS